MFPFELIKNTCTCVYDAPIIYLNLLIICSSRIKKILILEKFHLLQIFVIIFLIITNLQYNMHFSVYYTYQAIV